LGDFKISVAAEEGERKSEAREVARDTGVMPKSAILCGGFVLLRRGIPPAWRCLCKREKRGIREEGEGYL
jgi:hypothetical protein